MFNYGRVRLWGCKYGIHNLHIDLRPPGPTAFSIQVAIRLNAALMSDK